jgi:mannose/fructose-specific phosphotransferase system component IIA
VSASTGEAGSPAPVPAPQRVPAMLVMHADLAEALLHAASRVYGPVEDVSVISNQGASRAELERRIAEEAGRWPAGGLVLTDFWGGSCHTSGVAAARACRGVAILTGVNLPLLLDYLHNRDHSDVVALAERLMQKGRESIRVQHGPPA